MSSALNWLHSSSPSSRRNRGAYVAPSSGWGVACASPVSTDERTSINRSAPSSESTAVSASVVASYGMPTLRCAYTGPVSRPLSIRMIDTPVSLSPARIACAIGAAPRQRGSRDACTLIAPNRSRCSSGSGRICPYAATTMASGAFARMASMAPGSRIRAGVNTSIPASAATSRTGRGAGAPRLPGRSGCDTTATTSCFSTQRRSDGTANSAVPMKTVLTVPRQPANIARASDGADDLWFLRLRGEVELAERAFVDACRKQDAVEVINLVLHGACEQTVALHPHLLTVTVEALRDDAFAP